MKWFRSIMFLAVLGCLFVTNPSFAGERYLFVNLGDTANDIEYIKNALENGGSIHINMASCVQIDRNAESKYAVLLNDTQYYVPPAILNFIGDRGWKLHSVVGEDANAFIFVK